MQSRQWLVGNYNLQFADKPTQVGVQVVLPEAERQKLIERKDWALLANQGKSGTSIPLPEP
jgi:hypothetical protein